MDFALATSVAEMRPEFTPHSEIIGTLACLTPEQTGRTGRPVDQRADLYALGATHPALLEKEPDHRYQTAEGVVYDLERLRDVVHVELDRDR